LTYYLFCQFSAIISYCQISKINGFYISSSFQLFCLELEPDVENGWISSHPELDLDIFSLDILATTDAKMDRADDAVETEVEPDVALRPSEGQNFGLKAETEVKIKISASS